MPIKKTINRRTILPKGKITKKAIPQSGAVSELKFVKKEPIKVEESSEQAEEDRHSRATRTKRVCIFCQRKSDPSYTDLVTLQRFLTDRAKIVSRERSGVCSRHQRAIARNIKYARHLSLLPFVPKV